MGQARKARVVFCLGLATGLGLGGLLLLTAAHERPGGGSNPVTTLARAVVNGSYDGSHMLAGPRADALGVSPVVIVYLDLPSFSQAGQDPARAWPRDLHAKLLQRMTRAGARAVVFDIVFGAAGPDPAADEALASAMRQNQRVFLAGEYNNKASQVSDDSHPGVRLGSIKPPFAPFLDVARGWGLALQAIDDDYVVRRYVASVSADTQPALTWAATGALDPAALQKLDPHGRTRSWWVRYYGPALSIPHVIYSQALDPAGVHDDFFRDRIVFVGARPIVGLMQERLDEFRSPFHSWLYKDLFMPGVEVHATEMLNLLHGDLLRRLAPGVEALLVLVGALVFGAGLPWLRPIPAGVAALGGAGLALGLASLGFRHGVWFPWLIVSGVQAPLGFVGAVLHHSVDWYRVRRQLEQARREAEARIREQAALIDKAHDAIVVEDLAGKVVYANPSAERLYGWTLAELQEHKPGAGLRADQTEAESAARAEAIARGEWNGELSQRTRANEAVIVASRWTLIRDDQGQPKALLQMNRDITEQKQLETQFLRTQRLNTIGTLAGGMAHDLNNALAPILMGVQLLRRKTADEEAHRLLGLMETNTHRSADLVRQVLLFARGREAEFERLQLGQLIAELERLVRDTFPAGITVERFVPHDLWTVRGNPTQVYQVLLNLCVNARDAMPSGGRLSIAADNVELTQADAAAFPEAAPGAYVCLIVSDSGTGMTPEVRARIFEPFYTTKGEGLGTGIGLATVLRIVKAHGGFIRLESEPGHGTSFEVFLPRAPSVVVPRAEPDASQAARAAGECVLVVDDEQAIRELVSDALLGQGYRVLVAADGAEAVRLARTTTGPIHLVLTDASMPVMDGWQTITALREWRAGLPGILASGDEDVSGSGRRSLPSGVTVLRKPFALEELLLAVGQAIKDPPGGLG